MERTNSHLPLDPNGEMNSGARTMRYGAFLVLALAVAATGAPGCAEPGGLIDRTQANLVDKSIFQGEWWYMRTVVNIDDDAAWGVAAAGAGAPWPGAMSNYDIASRSGVVGRIRWVIDQNFLYAYRANEIVVGAADNPDDPNYLGQPMAIFPIDGHVDVRREYSPVTGEPSNVLSESEDRRWYDRQYVRVDWSRNLATWGLFGDSLDLDAELFGTFRRESVGNFVQEGGDHRIPDSWRPTFVRVGEDPSYRFREDWPTGTEETVHYMSFVTNELWTPMTCFGSTCYTSLRLSIRHAFLRVPPNHEYAVETLPNSEYDRFGIIRTEQRTYLRGGFDRSERGVYCDARAVATCEALRCTSDGNCGDGGVCNGGICIGGTYDNPDECGNGGRCTQNFDNGWGTAFGTCSGGLKEDIDDCGVGTMADYGTGLCAANLDADCGPGLCNMENHLCEGGLTPEYGETDFLTYYRLRHNFYRNSFARDPMTNETFACVADWQCDARFGGTGTSGSRCDAAAHVCTLPIAQREVRPVAYHLSPHYPRHLVRSAFETVAQWNETFMRGNRELHGLPQPGDVACQSTDPAGACFCGDGTTPPSYNMSDRRTCAVAPPRVACQDQDPTQYCFCGGTATAAEVAADRTCAYRENFFIPPTERGIDNPFDCWIGILGDDRTPESASRETDTINPSNPTSFDQYPADVYRYAFVGSECMFLLKNNSCDFPAVADQAPSACEELGDIRYQFFNYASGAGAGWCGVMQQVSDPTNGEAISVPINVGGQCLDSVATTALQLWPVLRGEVPEDQYFSGENMRGYFERLGTVYNPVGLSPALNGADYSPDDPSRPALPIDINRAINERMQEMSPQFESLRSSQEGRTLILSDRLRNLEGTSLEARLVNSLRSEGVNAIQSNDLLQATELNNQGITQPTDEQLLQQLSPFREGGIDDLMMEDVRRERILSQNYIEYPREAIFTSRYNHWWAEAFRDRPNAEAQIRFMQGFHKAVMLHEMGHGVGLEHNFAGSLDRDQYNDGYYSLVTQTDAGGDHPYALPEYIDFDCGLDGLCPGDPGYPGTPDENQGDSSLTGVELVAWAEALRAARTRRLQAGIGNYMSSSIMDYPGDYSDMSGLGHYDTGAAWFSYFNLVETYDGSPLYRAGAGTSLDGLLRADITPRRAWTYYRGGDACDVDADCPYAAGSTALVPGQRTYQRCIRNPRYSQIPTACGGDQNCLCSNFDEDMIDLAETSYSGYNPDTWGRCPADPSTPTVPGPRCRMGTMCPSGSVCNNDGISDYDRVDYLFCSNPRLSDISWCNTFDAGESFQELIDHYRQLWQEGYPRNYFRNYRRGFGTGSRAARYIVDAAKMYQHLFFRYYYEPEFRRETGPLGLDDQYFASIDAMNWLAELVQLPDVGSYQTSLIDGPADCDPRVPNPARPECHYGYRHMGNDLDMAGSDFNLDVGQGFYHWSRYQDGLYGFFRMERAGVFWDKLYALRALTTRDWGLGFTLDERYYINFYDLWPIEMTELFGGMVIDDPRWMAPRVRVDTPGEPQLYYLNFLLGGCREPNGTPTTCDREVTGRFPDLPLIGTSNEILRTYAAAYALAEFPVYYNPSFESRLAVFKLDNADGFTIPDVQLDGQTTCGFGGTIPGSSHVLSGSTAECMTAADADYIMYSSDRLHTTYVAVKVRERITYNLEEEQLGFQLLLRLYEYQQRVQQLAGDPTPTVPEREELSRSRRYLQAGESYLEALIDMQRIYGITSYF